MKVDIGIIGAMEIEVDALISMLSSHECETVSGIALHTGILEGKRVAIARCGIGKVFSAVSTEHLCFHLFTAFSEFFCLVCGDQGIDDLV